MHTDDQNNGREDEAFQAPAKLVAAFSRIDRQSIFVPPTLDEAVLREARRHLNKPERPRFPWRRWLPRFVAAAAVGLLAVFVLVRHNSVPPVFAREDLNHDGRVDILDAFGLARGLNSGPAPGPGQDFNGDGVVDEKDVETIAAQAVRLGKEGPS